MNIFKTSYENNNSDKTGPQKKKEKKISALTKQCGEMK